MAITTLYIYIIYTFIFGKVSSSVYLVSKTTDKNINSGFLFFFFSLGTCPS